MHSIESRVKFTKFSSAWLPNWDHNPGANRDERLGVGILVIEQLLSQLHVLNALITPCSKWAPKRRRVYPTPHPRAGKEAVAAAKGSQSAVQALIDEETPRSSSDEEQETVEGAVFSSDEEEADYDF